MKTQIAENNLQNLWFNRSRVGPKDGISNKFLGLGLYLEATDCYKV